MSESMQYDVVIVGAGPAGLATAIRLQQMSGSSMRVCVLEKGAQVGAHILSGAVFEPQVLHQLLPDHSGAPLGTPVTSDAFHLLTQRRSWRLPTPAPLKNRGNHIISLGKLCQWLAQQAESLGVDIFPGFAGERLLFSDHGAVCGIHTGTMGLNRHGEKTDRYQPGLSIQAQQVVLAEGCRGSLSQQAIVHFDLAQSSSPQTYGLGLKEVWRIPSESHQLGRVIHTIGWPLDQRTYGGGFIYFTEDHQVSIGLVVGLDYQNPHLNPFEELQRLKTHPWIRRMLTGGERLSYGARALVEGGWQALPRLSFPGGLLVGDSAGLLHVAKLKGSHHAMQSGIWAAEHIHQHLQNHAQEKEVAGFDAAVKQSWVGQALYRSRNIRPAFHHGLWPGLIYSALDHHVLRGRAPWTLQHRADHTQLRSDQQSQPIAYPKPDGQITFDRLSSVHLTNTFHQEHQPCHLILKEPERALSINQAQYQSPETRYCPAGVYEIISHGSEKRLQINAQNCIHCKSCDIKDPTQNILWQPPEGGGGPNYVGM